MPAVEPGLPPGPRWPRLLQTALWATQPGWLARYCQRRFGDTFTLRPLGLGDVVTIASPQTIKQIFGGVRDVFHAGEANAVMGPIIGKSSLLTLDGERHLRHRRMLTAPFHGEAVRAYRERVEAITATEVQRWPVGQEFAIRPRMQAITLEVILQAVVGVSDPRRLTRLRELLGRLTKDGILEMWLLFAYPKLALALAHSRADDAAGSCPRSIGCCSMRSRPAAAAQTVARARANDRCTRRARTGAQRSGAA